MFNMTGWTPCPDCWVMPIYNTWRGHVWFYLSRETLVSFGLQTYSPTKVAQEGTKTKYKWCLCSAPVLVAPNFTRPFKLDVDAGAQGAGAVLIQENDRGIDHPVGYFSPKFKRHQLHYSTIEKEAPSLLLALQHFAVYVGSTSMPTVVFSHHNPLVFLKQMRNSNRLMHCSLLVQDFNIEV